MEYDKVSQTDDFTALADFVDDVERPTPDPTTQVAASGAPEAAGAPQQQAVTAEVIGKLTEDIIGLRAVVDKGFALLDRQSDLVDRLHSENERLRRGEFERMLDPIIRDLVALADSCLRNADAWLSRPTTTPTDVHRVLGDVASDISLLLERQGVDAFAPAPGEPFDRRQQRAAATELTSQPEQNGTIARTLRPGYRSGTRTIRFAEVVVLDYEPPAPEPAAPDHPGPGPSTP
ncbi:nucleotide exchange factor GrpE [Parafrankia sp. FMc2]|uniref:nucleotide exchange factor GrpE n=1 Tax=Parafrankia sp. FMc2 TaxID=3233196 RepID=UPI0034D56E1B